MNDITLPASHLTSIVNTRSINYNLTSRLNLGALATPRRNGFLHTGGGGGYDLPRRFAPI